jgi:hypothetical protein
MRTNAGVASSSHGNEWQDVPSNKDAWGVRWGGAMETVSFVLVIFLLMGLIRRLTGARDRVRRLGPGTPANFLCFTGTRLIISKRTHAYLPEE